MHIPGRFMRHTARLKDAADVRVVVVYKQLPNDPVHALVVFPDRLVRNVDRDEIIRLVQLPDAQATEDFANIMHKHKMLTFFHEQGFLKKVHIDEIEMTPTAANGIPLRTVLDEIAKSNGLNPLPTDNEIAAAKSATNPRADEIAEGLIQNEDKEAIAKSILYQASLLEKDVQAKREEAYNLAPHLRPGNTNMGKAAKMSDLERDRSTSPTRSNPELHAAGPEEAKVDKRAVKTKK